MSSSSSSTISSLLFVLISLSLLLSTAQAYPSYVYADDGRSDFNVPVVRRSPSHSAMRNCFFSPVQCMMPMQSVNFNGFHKRLN
ncbi:hypothetical protein PRIPAC_76482 [Pristionchus pacificus]|uniref:Uncharacterized protein n=1 Tax=Pristionchus pacificus TaxID=54126 RepID=A0A2A6C7Z6_PRIPA|nr:hypothetical protein PRIPAC_76482 [Pristionchus pacificus]|eukprot:PDM74151.1 hypothetical protein PRIPAC_41507 [Pristionchus pacificus]